jgi:hypothetical protein
MSKSAKRKPTSFLQRMLSELFAAEQVLSSRQILDTWNVE